MSWYRAHIVLQRLTRLSACACLVLVAFAAVGGGPYRIADFEPGDVGLTDPTCLIGIDRIRLGFRSAPHRSASSIAGGLDRHWRDRPGS